MAKQPEKSKAKDRDKKHEEPEHPKPQAQGQPPKQRSQVVGQPGTGGTAPDRPPPIPRPQFRAQPHRSPPHVSDDTQRVINSLQQTVRSQAILIVQYQTLLKLDAMREAENGQNGQNGAEEAA